MDKAEDPSILMRAVAELPSQMGIYRSQRYTFAQAQAEERQMKAVWTYGDTSKPVGDADHLKVFADPRAGSPCPSRPLQEKERPKFQNETHRRLSFEHFSPSACRRDGTRLIVADLQDWKNRGFRCIFPI
jgi:hypothetical protein